MADKGKKTETAEIGKATAKPVFVLPIPKNRLQQLSSSAEESKKKRPNAPSLRPPTPPQGQQSNS